MNSITETTRMRPARSLKQVRRTPFSCCILCLLFLMGRWSAAAGEWKLTYGQSLADHQSNTQTLTNQGFRPSCLDADGTGAAASYSAVWVKDGITDWISEVELTAGQLNDRNANLARGGYRILCLDGRDNYPQELYAAVWVKDPQATASGIVLRDLNCASYPAWTTNGYVPTWWDVNTSSGYRFGIVYQKGSGGWGIWYGMSEDVFRQRLEEYSVWGWPSVVRTANGAYAAVWIDHCLHQSEDVKVELGHTALELGSAIQHYSNEGYEPFSVSQSGQRFNTVWRRPFGSLEPGRIDSLQRFAQGQVQLRVQNESPGDLARFFVLVPLQASTSMEHWEPLMTLFATNASSAPVLGIDAEAVNLNARFYRTPANRFITPLLKPTGPFGVGEFSELLIDPDRLDPRTGKNVQFMVTCWYPAAAQGGLLPAPYIERVVAGYTQLHVSSSRLADFAAHSVAGVPLAPSVSRCAVLLYSPDGVSHRRENLMLVEELASHGFVVVSLDHQDTPASVYPDGTVAEGKWIDSIEEAAARQPDRTADARRVLDQLTKWQNAHPLLAGHLDLEHIGAFGYGLGGSIAADLANSDARCDAAANLDGYLFGNDLVASGPRKPYLMLHSDTPDPQDENDNRLSFFQKSTAAAYYLKVAGTCGASFGPMGLVQDLGVQSQLFGQKATTEGCRAQSIARSALLSFFRRHLLSVEDGVLDLLVTNSPDVCLALDLNGGLRITETLTNTTVRAGDPLTLSVAAAGQTLSYEWSLNGAPLPEASAPVLTIPEATSASAGRYAVRVRDGGGTASCFAVVKVVPLLFTQQPRDVKVPYGPTATFWTKVSSLKPVNYQWQHDGQDIAGATSDTLILSNVGIEALGLYSVRVSNGYGAEQSATVRLILGPRFVERPQNQILSAGRDLVLSAQVVGTPPMTYTWRHQNVYHSRLTSDVLTSSFRVANVQAANAGTYWLTVTNAVGTAAPGLASSSVLVVQPPTDQHAVAGSTVTFSSTVNRGFAGQPGLQWQFQGADIEGATADTLTLTDVKPGDAGIYTLLVTNNIDRSAAFSATLSVSGN